MNVQIKAPWHLWAVGIVSLLWNGFGAMDYLRTKMQDHEYVASMSEPFGIELEEALAYFEAFPFWVDMAWALGVWGAVLGSVLLLFRNRLAVIAFAISLAGLVVGAAYQLAVPMPGIEDTTLPLVLTVILFAIACLLLWYARAMKQRGVLK